jgi:NAD(P)-dependent dehydrogenase (short-subunit alcohol dehydrogenase family)
MPQPNYEHPFTKTYHKKPYPAIDPTQPALSAAGKTILITAGHTGIGHAVAQNFATAGASNIIILARRLEVLEKAAKDLSIAHPSTKVHFFAASITDHKAIKRIFLKIRDTIAEIDILVTSAAYVAPSFPILELPGEQLEASFATNVLGNSNLVREFLDTDTTAEKTIIDISSLAAHLYLPRISAYSITKLAFTQWMAHLHEELGNKGVRIHSLHPGGPLTEAVRAFGMTEDMMDWDDVQLSGQFVIWLASDEAGFLGGRFVWANWDVEELVARKQEFEADKDLLKIGLIGGALVLK